MKDSSIYLFHSLLSLKTISFFMLSLSSLFFFSGCTEKINPKTENISEIQIPEKISEKLNLKNFSAINYQDFSQVKKEKNSLTITLKIF